jgi:hypothetical protein
MQSPTQSGLGASYDKTQGLSAPRRSHTIHGDHAAITPTHSMQSTRVHRGDLTEPQPSELQLKETPEATAVMHN